MEFRVFSLPFALTFTELYDPIQIMLEIFFITFGFVGIEQVSMALDDPFGKEKLHRNLSSSGNCTLMHRFF